MLTEPAQELPCVDETKAATQGSSPQWRRAALAVTAASQSTTAARSSLCTIVTIVVTTTVTWTAPTRGPSEAAEGALWALKWTPRANATSSQNSEHDSRRAIAVRSQWCRRRRAKPIFTVASLPKKSGHTPRPPESGRASCPPPMCDPSPACVSSALSGPPPGVVRPVPQPLASAPHSRPPLGRGRDPPPSGVAPPPGASPPPPHLSESDRGR